jgi:hypothetical protein
MTFTQTLHTIRSVGQTPAAVFSAPAVSFLSVSLLMVSLLSNTARAEITYPEVHEVEAAPAAYLGRAISLVGRFDSAVNRHMRLVDSQIDFVLAPVTRKPPTDARHVRISGQLRRDGDNLRFDANYVTTTLSEADTFAARRVEIKPDDAQALYSLSSWTRVRGEWYNDRQLKRQSAESFRDAFRVEEDNIAGQGDSESLLAHAARGERLNLEASDVIRIRHRALWLSLAADQSATGAPAKGEVEWHALAERIAGLLPGAKAPPDEAALPIVAGYWDDPVAAYEAAEAPTRAAMHRALWSEAMVRGYQATRSADDHDAVALFEEARQTVPERAAWLREVELDALDVRASRLGALSRPELDELRAAYDRLDEHQRAVNVSNAWLAARRDALVQNDADGRIRLAEAYRQLASDDASAAALYVEALSISPNLPEARRGATELGYRKMFGRWQHPDQLSEAERIEWQREQEGRIEPGDSETDVVRRFRRPDRISRTITSSALVEKWIYDGPPPLEIFLRRRVAGGEAIVTAVASP